MNDATSTDNSSDRPHEFWRLLSRLDSNPRAAGEKYNSLHRRLTKVFEWNNCYPAEDYADEALRRVERKLETEDIHDVQAYCMGVAHNIRFEANKKRIREISLEDLTGGSDGMASNLQVESDIIAGIDGRKWLACLKTCLDGIKASDRKFILSYYTSEDQKPKDQRRKLAEANGATADALKARASRIRDVLERCVASKMRLRALILRFSEGTIY